MGVLRCGAIRPAANPGLGPDRAWYSSACTEQELSADLYIFVFNLQTNHSDIQVVLDVTRVAANGHS
jgi:hypothetical protein